MDDSQKNSSSLQVAVLILGLIVASPVIIAVVYIVAVALYFKAIEPVYKKIHYAPNYERECDKIADPVRVNLRGLRISVPAKNFQPASLTRCYGGVFVPVSRGCVTGQKIKTFKDDVTKKEITGFCQADYEPDFVIDRAMLEFDNSSEIPFQVKQAGRPASKKEPQTIIFIEGATKGDFREHCKDKSLDSYSMFGNPLTYNCWFLDKEKQTKRCAFKAFIGDEYIVHLGNFNEREFPREAWLEYFSHIENKLTPFILDLPAGTFLSKCKLLDKQN